MQAANEIRFRRSTSTRDRGESAARILPGDGLTSQRFIAPSLLAMLIGVLTLPLVGCGQATLEFTEIKRIDEPLTEQELNTFFNVIQALPDGKLPSLPPIYAPPPNWNRTRTLLVYELVNMEEKELSERRRVEWFVRHIARNRRLRQVLGHNKMTPEQFIGLMLTIGTAVNRTTLRENQELTPLIKENLIVRDKLRGDKRLFSSLSDEGRHYVVHQATSLTRIDRADRLLAVPQDNVNRVAVHLDRLKKILPEDFFRNPLDEVADPIQERGIPFAELSSTDAKLTWNRTEAAIGNDPPDRELAEHRLVGQGGVGE